MILRTRTPILRTPNTASGTNISANNESSGSCDTMTTTSPTIVSASRESVVMRRLSTLLADWAMKDCRAMNIGRMRAAVIGDLHPQHLVEDAPLDVGDNAVADPRQDDLLPVGRKALDGVDDDDRRGDFPHRRKLRPTKISLTILPMIQAESAVVQRDQAHHRESEGVALPVLGALVGQQPAQDRVRGRVEEESAPVRGLDARETMFQSLAPADGRTAFLNRCQRIPLGRGFHIIGGEIMEIAGYVWSRAG